MEAVALKAEWTDADGRKQAQGLDEGPLAPQEVVADAGRRRRSADQRLASLTRSHRWSAPSRGGVRPTMENIRHQRAVAQVDADIKPLQRKADLAKADVRKLAGGAPPSHRGERRAAGAPRARAPRRFRQAPVGREATSWPRCRPRTWSATLRRPKAAVDRIKALRARVIIDAGIRPLEEKTGRAKAQVKGLRGRQAGRHVRRLTSLSAAWLRPKARLQGVRGAIASGEVVVDRQRGRERTEVLDQLAALRRRGQAPTASAPR